MLEKILKSKGVGFLVADAELNQDNAEAFFTIAGAGDTGVLGKTLKKFKEKHGGLWVGGKMLLTPTTIHLNANWMNRIAQDGTLDIEVPLASIRNVRFEKSLITHIVRLDTDEQCIKFRCFGAKEVAALIKETILAQASLSVR